MLPCRSLCALPLLWVALACAASAATTPNDPKGQMDEIFFLSGLEAQLGVVGESLGAAIEPQIRYLPPAQGEALQRAVLREFDAEVLQREVERHLERAHDPRHAESVLQWLRSPVGRRITKLDLAASRPEAAVELQTYALGLANNPPPAARIALIRQLDAATGMTDFTVDATLTSALATALGAGSALSTAQPDSEQEIRAMLEAQQQLLRPEIERMMTTSMLYSYRSLEDDELRSYIDFSQSESGRWYHESVKRALLDTLEGASTRVGRALAAAFAATPAPTPAHPAP